MPTATRRFPQPMRLLTATVLVALSAVVAQTAQAQPFGHGGPAAYGAMGAMGGERQVGRLLDSVNATPEQRAQIKAILETARTEMKAQREAGRTLRERGQALFAQPTVDARAAEALRQQVMAQHDAASKRALQVMLDVSRVLTPEQRQTLAERMSQRRSLMERQHGERESLDKGSR